MKPIEISREANQNYLAKIFVIDNIKKHPDAEKLQIVNVDFIEVVTGLEAKLGDIYIFIPAESKLNSDFLAFTNSFRKSELNRDKTRKGFVEDNLRIRCVKLRGIISAGYIIPVKDLEAFAGISLENYVGEYFDTVIDSNNTEIKLIEKYVPKRVINNVNGKSAKTTNVSKIVEKQFYFSVDVENFRRNCHKINPNTIISVSKKFHGTNFVCSHVLIKKELNGLEKFIVNKLSKIKLISRFLPEVKSEEYGYVFSSRRVIKSVESEIVENKQHFYESDLWTTAGENIVKGKLPKGYSIFCEIVGYVPETQGFIQKGYDYGCIQGCYEIYVFRVTYTNNEGHVFNLNLNQCKDFCERSGLKFVDVYYFGKAGNMFPDISISEHWNEEFLKRLETTYLEGYDETCKSSNKIPFEGIVIRVEENPFQDLEIWKLKSMLFLERETKMLDEGIDSDIELQEESENS